MALQLRVFVPPHPLLKNWLALVREASTPMPLFKTGLTEIGRWLTYEAIRDWLPMDEVMVNTPLAESPAQMIRASTPIAVVPILRAGLVLLDGMTSVLPAAAVYHVGMARDEETLEPHCYLNKLPDRFADETLVLVSEPMLATGGTIDFVLGQLMERGLTPERVRVISVVAAPPALQILNANYPGLTIYTTTIDEQLDDRGFIVPGLGDAGDRAFGTM